jgi:hypothetical protein
MGGLTCTGDEDSLEQCHNGEGWSDGGEGTSNWPTSWCDAEWATGVSCTFRAPSEDCEACPAGKRSNEVGPQPCAPCEIATYSETAGANECEQCPAKRPVSYAGTGSSSVNDCEPHPSNCTDVRERKFYKERNLNLTLPSVLAGALRGPVRRNRSCE